MNGTIAYALARKYAQKLSCGIQSSSYDPASSTMQVTMNDGSTYDVVFDDGVSVQDRQTLDNVTYSDGALEVNGTKVITEDDIATDPIDFSGMF